MPYVAQSCPNPERSCVLPAGERARWWDPFDPFGRGTSPDRYAAHELRWRRERHLPEEGG